MQLTLKTWSSELGEHEQPSVLSYIHMSTKSNQLRICCWLVAPFSTQHDALCNIKRYPQQWHFHYSEAAQSCMFNTTLIADCETYMQCPPEEGYRAAEQEGKNLGRMFAILACICVLNLIAVMTLSHLVLSLAWTCALTTLRLLYHIIGFISHGDVRELFISCYISTMRIR